MLSKKALGTGSMIGTALPKGAARWGVSTALLSVAITRRSLRPHGPERRPLLSLPWRRDGGAVAG